MIAVNIDVIIPIERVTAKPLTGPVPKLNKTNEAINVVMLASAIVNSAFAYPAEIAF